MGVFNQRILRTGGTALRIAGTTGAKGDQTESHCRERPMCRSVTSRLKPVRTKQNHPSIMSFRANVVSRGIFPSGKFYLVVVHYPTWWIPPLRLRYGRNDMTGVFLYYRKWFRPFTCGTAHRPFPTVSLTGGRFQPGDSKNGRIWGKRFYEFAYCF